jgi:DNA repair protein RadC
MRFTQYMVEQLRQREQERLQNSLSREELFTILITWSVPVTHLTEIERRKRQEIVDRFHRQSAQQLIHAMFVGRPLFQKILDDEETFEEIEVIRRASSKNPNEVAVREEQEAFVRTCIKSKSQMVSSKKLLEKVPSLHSSLNSACL